MLVLSKLIFFIANEVKCLFWFCAHLLQPDINGIELWISIFLILDTQHCVFKTPRLLCVHLVNYSGCIPHRTLYLDSTPETDHLPPTPTNSAMTNMNVPVLLWACV